MIVLDEANLDPIWKLLFAANFPILNARASNLLLLLPVFLLGRYKTLSLLVFGIMSLCVTNHKELWQPNMLTGVQ